MTKAKHDVDTADLGERVAALAARVIPTDERSAEQARERYDGLVKPPGSLGRLEQLGAQLGAIARTCPPPVPNRATVVVCAGDHGVLAQGVSPWPQQITAQMVQTFCAGRAAINVLAETIAAEVTVLDVGVATDLPAHPRLHNKKVRPGSRDLSNEPALTRAEAAQALLAGASLATELHQRGAEIIIGGDMGIGNTTAGACLIATFTGLPATQTTGRGTGIDDTTHQRKTALVQAALELHHPDPTDPLAVLACFGGLEHAALCGLYLAAASNQLPVLLDGVAANAAALAAAALTPHIHGYLIGGHRSTEPGAIAALAALNLQPLLDLQLRLGEGTGALLALPLLRAAAATLHDMATVAELANSHPVK